MPFTSQESLKHRGQVKDEQVTWFYRQRRFLSNQDSHQPSWLGLTAPSLYTLN